MERYLLAVRTILMCEKIILLFSVYSDGFEYKFKTKYDNDGCLKLLVFSNNDMPISCKKLNSYCGISLLQEMFNIIMENNI